MLSANNVSNAPVEYELVPLLFIDLAALSGQCRVCVRSMPDKSRYER